MKIKLIVFSSLASFSLAQAMDCGNKASVKAGKPMDYGNEAFTKAGRLQYHLLGRFKLKEKEVTLTARQLVWLFTDPAKVPTATEGIQSAAKMAVEADLKNGNHNQVNALIESLQLASSVGVVEENNHLAKLANNEPIPEEQQQALTKAMTILIQLTKDIQRNQDNKQSRVKKTTIQL